MLRNCLRNTHHDNVPISIVVVYVFLFLQIPLTSIHASKLFIYFSFYRSLSLPYTRRSYLCFFSFYRSLSLPYTRRSCLCLFSFSRSLSLPYTQPVYMVPARCLHQLLHQWCLLKLEATVQLLYRWGDVYC